MRAASGAGKLVTLTKAHLSVFPSVACAVAGTSKGPRAAPSAGVASRVRCRATHLRARQPVTLCGAGDRGPVGPSRPEPRAQQLCPARPVVIRAALSALRPVSAPTPLSRWDSRAERRAPRCPCAQRHISSMSTPRVWRRVFQHCPPSGPAGPPGRGEPGSAWAPCSAARRPLPLDPANTRNPSGRQETLGPRMTDGGGRHPLPVHAAHCSTWDTVSKHEGSVATVP